MGVGRGPAGQLTRVEANGGWLGVDPETVVGVDPLRTQLETARHLVVDRRAHQLITVKGSQPTLLAAYLQALPGQEGSSHPYSSSTTVGTNVPNNAAPA